MPNESLRQELEIIVWGVNHTSVKDYVDAILAAFKKRLPEEYHDKDDIQQYGIWNDGYNQYRKEVLEMLEAENG